MPGHGLQRRPPALTGLKRKRRPIAPSGIAEALEFRASLMARDASSASAWFGPIAMNPASTYPSILPGDPVGQ